MLLDFPVFSWVSGSFVFPNFSDFAWFSIIFSDFRIIGLKDNTVYTTHSPPRTINDKCISAPKMHAKVIISCCSTKMKENYSGKHTYVNIRFDTKLSCLTSIFVENYESIFLKSFGKKNIFWDRQSSYHYSTTVWLLYTF